MASPNLSEIITTTLRDRSGTLADNVTNHNALLRHINQKGNRKPAHGRTIVQELEYAENGTTGWYSGYENLDITPQDVFSAAEFDWKQLAGNVSVSGLEEIQNSGEEAVINLVASRIKNLEKSLMNTVATGVYADGTGSGGKELGGLQLLMADDPTTGTVGGIDRSVSTNTFYRNYSYDSTTDGGAAATAALIQGYMNQVWLTVLRGNDKPDVIAADTNYYKLYWESLQTIQRVMSDKDAAAGFANLKYFGPGGSADVIYDDQAPTNHMYFINTDYLFLRFHPERDFAPLDKRESINQDATIRPLVWAGNMTLSNGSQQGLLKD